MSDDIFDGLIAIIIFSCSVVVSLIIVGFLHLILKRAGHKCCCLGMKIAENLDRNEQRGSRRERYEAEASKWRKSKEKEMRKLMKPKKFSTKSQEFDNQTDCCICQETLKQSAKLIITTPCKHQFHEPCIWVWFNQKLEYNMRMRSGELDPEDEAQPVSCPMCNVAIFKEDEKLPEAPQPEPFEEPIATENILLQPAIRPAVHVPPAPPIAVRQPNRTSQMLLIGQSSGQGMQGSQGAQHQAPVAVDEIQIEMEDLEQQNRVDPDYSDESDGEEGSESEDSEEEAQRYQSERVERLAYASNLVAEEMKQNSARKPAASKKSRSV